MQTKFDFCPIRNKDHLNPMMWLSGVPQGSMLVYLYYCGERFLRRVVSLSSGYFLQKPFPLKGYMGVEVVNE